MKVTKINYERLFPLAPYINHKIGYEAEITIGDYPEEVIKTLSDMAIKAHQELFDSFNMNASPEQIGEMQVDKTQSPDETLINQIKSCDDVKVLQSYRLIVRHKKELQDVYNNKLKELTNV